MRLAWTRAAAQLANRVLRIKLPYCDDFIGYDCMVSGTPFFEYIFEFLGFTLLIVLFMHISLPSPEEIKADERFLKEQEEFLKEQEEEEKEEKAFERFSRRMTIAAPSMTIAAPSPMLDELERLEKMKSRVRSGCTCGSGGLWVGGTAFLCSSPRAGWIESQPSQGALTDQEFSAAKSKLLGISVALTEPQALPLGPANPPSAPKAPKVQYLDGVNA